MHLIDDRSVWISLVKLLLSPRIPTEPEVSLIPREKECDMKKCP